MRKSSKGKREKEQMKKFKFGSEGHVKMSTIYALLRGLEAVERKRNFLQHLKKVFPVKVLCHSPPLAYMCCLVREESQHAREAKIAF